MKTITTHHRILGIDPGTRYMGFAILDGRDLVAYGVKDLKKERPAHRLLKRTADILHELIARYEVGILAYEKTFYVQQKSSAMLHVQELEVARLARTAGLRVWGESPARVRAILCDSGRATKQAVANRLVQRFPELAGYRQPMPPKRERYWLNMFDALAVATVVGDRVRETSEDGEAVKLAA